MTKFYTDMQLSFPPQQWTTPRVLSAQAALRPSATFLSAPEEGQEWTYGQMLDSAQRIASGLLAAGATPGDRVVVLASNSSAFVRSWLGVACASLVMVPINTALEGKFLSHQLNTVDARWAIVDDALVDRLLAVSDDITMPDRLWVIDTGRQAETLANLRAKGIAAEAWTALDASVAREHIDEPSPRDLAAILFTSGTTGPSKGVAMPHAQMYFFADTGLNLTRLTSADTYMTVTPLFHGNALFLAAYPALIAGAKLVLHSGFSASRWIDQVRQSGATVTNFVGVMMDFVWNQPERPDDADNALRCIFAAPTASTLVDGFKKRFGIEAFVELFGLTETSAPILTPYGEDRPPGACGLHAKDWFDIRLVDPETDEEVEIGEIGELVVRPRLPWTCSLGYWGMPEKTVEAWRNLWFHTGDALRQDKEGWYYFVDRFKDALRRRGENISSFEVEHAILEHPAVAECAVVAVPAEVEAGEDEVLAVIVKAGDLKAEDVWEWCDGRVPSFAIPRFIRFADALPKTPSEKVRKAELRAAGLTPDTHDRQAKQVSPRP